MTAFARNDLMSIAIPIDSGGCGQIHARPIVNEEATKRKKDPAEPEYSPIFAVECAACEPVLLSPVHGWAKAPERVELTPDEVEEQERQEKVGNKAQAAMAHALGEKLAEMVASPTTVA